MGGTEKGGGDTKILKRGQPGLRDGCLKKRGAETPLQTRGGVEGGQGARVWVNPLKKENLWHKSFCQMLNEVLKICEK